MTTRKEIADVVFPDITETVSDLEKKYPERSNPICSRFAPSPTGFLHIGAIFSSFVPWKFVYQNKGTFLLRIEDTDQKRTIENGIEQIVDMLKMFGIPMNEGPLGVNNSDVGNYGPYTQSKRKKLYEVFVKDLISQGKAYPCWMSEEEMNSLRENQMKSKVAPGIYGNYSIWRNKSPEEVMEKMKADNNFIIRFRCHGDLTKRIVFEDVIRGKLNMNDNYNDVVLVKGDGLPTYHMAHIVDDHLMRVSNVIRGEEWLMSVPLHLQLFEACGLIPPKYAHVAQLLKLDDGKKRKLSKRTDPEANMEFFFENGYANQGIIEYVLTIVDPNFEAWQAANIYKDYHDYEIVLEKMNKSGALFDLVKLQSVNNNYLSRISTVELYDQTLVWAKKYKSDLAALMASNEIYAKAAMDIERHTEKDPKRFTTFVDVDTQLRLFFDGEREKSIKDVEINIDKEVAQKFVEEYISVLDLSMSVEDWFAQLKEIGKKYGFAGNNAEFKEGGYIGKIGELAMFLRLKLLCSAQTPDLFSVMKVMGNERVEKRLKS